MMLPNMSDEAVEVCAWILLFILIIGAIFLGWIGIKVIYLISTL